MAGVRAFGAGCAGWPCCHTSPYARWSETSTPAPKFVTKATPHRRYAGSRSRRDSLYSGVRISINCTTAVRGPMIRRGVVGLSQHRRSVRASGERLEPQAIARGPARCHVQRRRLQRPGRRILRHRQRRPRPPRRPDAGRRRRPGRWLRRHPLHRGRRDRHHLRHEWPRPGLRLRACRGHPRPPQRKHRRRRGRQTLAATCA